MADLTVLGQVATELDGWADLRAWLVTERVARPSVFVTSTSKWGDATWRCSNGHWTGQVCDYGGVDPDAEPVAAIQTTIPADATANEVADGIKTIYRLLRTAPDSDGGARQLTGEER